MSRERQPRGGAGGALENAAGFGQGHHRGRAADGRREDRGLPLGQRMRRGFRQDLHRFRLRWRDCHRCSAHAPRCWARNWYKGGRWSAHARGSAGARCGRRDSHRRECRRKNYPARRADAGHSNLLSVVRSDRSSIVKLTEKYSKEGSY
jgi:hypothetical protein